jgi:hypothetical protein
MKIRFRFRPRQIVKWSLAVLSLGWMIGAIWVLFIQPSPTSNVYGSSYNSPQARLAKCRTLMSSEARYQCTSSIMLERDNAVFNQSLIVVLPVFGLVMVYLSVTRLIAAHKERVKSRLAIAASRKRMAEWRRQKAAAAAAAAAQPMATTLAPARIPAGRPSGAIPPRPSRRQ